MTREKEIRDYVLRAGRYRGRALLSADYRRKLVEQEGFEDYNRLFRGIVKHYAEEHHDAEFDRLTLCFLNSTFWDYGQYTDAEGNVSERILSDMTDNMLTTASVNRNLEELSNVYRHREDRFYEEKIILNQQLRSMVVFFKQDQFPYLWELIPLVLLRELENNGRRVLLFSTSEQETACERLSQAGRESIIRELRYLDDDYESGRIVSHQEYEELEREIIEIADTGLQPDSVSPLRLTRRGSLESGDSYKYISYGVSRVYWKIAERIPRQSWIDYLSVKIGKEKRLLSKKFTSIPDGWEEKMRGRLEK